MKRTPHPLRRYFPYGDHLPPGKPQEIMRALHLFSAEIDAKVPDCAEKSAGMRKLLEAKDCFVRASLDP